MTPRVLRKDQMPDSPSLERPIEPFSSRSLTEPSWLTIARAELGVAEYPEGASNPRITRYHAGTNIEGYDDKVSWCSSFIHWTLGQAGIQGTASALARSWLSWGEPLDAPVPGCIAVLWREEPQSWKGHVGYYLRRADDHWIVLLGGNQYGAVREHRYAIATVLSYRWPASVPLPAGDRA